MIQEIKSKNLKKYENYSEIPKEFILICHINIDRFISESHFHIATWSTKFYEMSLKVKVRFNSSTKEIVDIRYFKRKTKRYLCIGGPLHKQLVTGDHVIINSGVLGIYRLMKPIAYIKGNTRRRYVAVWCPRD